MTRCWQGSSKEKSVRNGNGGLAGSEDHHEMPKTLSLHVDIGKIEIGAFSSILRW